MLVIFEGYCLFSAMTFDDNLFIERIYMNIIYIHYIIYIRHIVQYVMIKKNKNKYIFTGEIKFLN